MLWSGAAPLGDQTIRDILTMFPSWTVGQGYGMDNEPTWSDSVDGTP